jgi:zinc protease
MKPERVRFSNGLTVLYRQSHDLPLAAGTLLVRAGSAADPKDKPGLSHLVAELLPQGTRRHDARRFAAQLEIRGAALGAHATEDYSEMGFIAPETELEETLSLAGEMLSSPRFSPAELEKERAHTRASLRARQDAIFNIAHDRFMTNLYGEHPYSRLTEGTAKGLGRITPGDLKRWHQRTWTPLSSILSVEASWPWRKARKILERSFAGWKRSESTSPAGDKISSVVRGGKNKLDRMTSRFEQAYLMTGLLAPAVDHPDAIVLKMLNTVLGGGMSSRLFVQLREELGLAYEVSSFFPTRLGPSHWACYLGCSPEKLSAAGRRLDELLEELAQKGPTESEVAQAKAMIKGSFAMDHQTRRRRAWYRAWWEFLGRDLDYDRVFLKRLEAVPLSDVRRVAKELLSQPRLTVEVAPS